MPHAPRPRGDGNKRDSRSSSPDRKAWEHELPCENLHESQAKTLTGEGTAHRVAAYRWGAIEQERLFHQRIDDLDMRGEACPKYIENTGRTLDGQSMVFTAFIARHLRFMHTEFFGQFPL